AERTTRLAGRAAGRRLEAAAARMDAVGRQAERAVLIQVGAAAELRDQLASTAQTYTNLNRVARELDRFERRGARALNKGERKVSRARREVKHEARTQANGIRSEAADVADRIKQLA
ncbi:MAG: hypothetical protein M3Z27_10420, partial [Actinomycetota bacterium]|nr:hypothetical protein [Actinomycetota bacterium]